MGLMSGIGSLAFAVAAFYTAWTFVQIRRGAIWTSPWRPVVRRETNPKLFVLHATLFIGMAIIMWVLAVMALLRPDSLIFGQGDDPVAAMPTNSAAGPDDLSALDSRCEEDSASLRRVPPFPKVLHRELPDTSACTEEGSGNPILEAEIGIDGRAGNIRVLRSAGHCIDTAAVAALGKWRFCPNMVDGMPRPVTMRFMVNVNYR